MKKYFSTDYLVKLGLPYSAVASKTILEDFPTYVLKEIIFMDDGKFYKTTYSRRWHMVAFDNVVEEVRDKSL